VIAVLQGRGQAAGTVVVVAQSRGATAGWLQPEGGAGCEPGWSGSPGSGPSRGAGPAGPGGNVRRRAGRRPGRGRGGQDLTGPAQALSRGVAKDRRISIEDVEMFYGRKFCSMLSGGYKRHVAARSGHRPRARRGASPGQHATGDRNLSRIAV